ncbi:BTAD domain-containing putative transcriptional regulator [Mycobacterium sp. B14F4]|uniref:BTAD domain-containing putative transcriptional regulator n=1 Tax=Mycobacterium sp. B14F4 TaxID=3153565 RepID=UPI00325E624B
MARVGTAPRGSVRYGILGPLSVATDNGPIRMASRTQRHLLAVLLVEANRVVSTERLVEELWPDDIPSDPAGALRTQISRLRKLLPPPASLVTEEGGYRLLVAPEEVDATRFDRLITQARGEHYERALPLLDEALALWRGRVLGEFVVRPFALPEVRRLEELHGAAREDRAALLLVADRAAEAAADMNALIAEQPGRERARGLLMQALYHQGRHTEALDAYQSWRCHLVDALGLEPSPALQRVEREILQHELGGGSTPAVARSRVDVPRAVSTFLGRDDDLCDVGRLLGEVRLLTLWGPGGVGKTRLALEVANEVSSRYRDGIHFCDLAVITRSAHVTRAVATVVGVREKAFTPLEAQLLDDLASRRALVILDNCEHVLEGTARLADRIIRSTLDVDILATSRERLSVDGEHLWEVRPLPVKGPNSPAVCLFVDRARATDAAFSADTADIETVAEVCRQLDGLPLAIELAAARVRGLSLQDLTQRLDERFTILTAGPRTEGRHRSLTAVLDWSYAQLEPIEQQVFNRLAVFVGPFGLDAACSVVAGDAVTYDAVIAAVLRLVDCALLSELPGSAARRYALLDTMRRYALDRLRADDEVEAARDRHAQWAVVFAEHAAIKLSSSDESDWETRLTDSIDELRAAHTWLVGRNANASLRLVSSLRPYALWRGQSEVFRWADVAVASAAATDSPMLPHALFAAETGAWQRGDVEGATAVAAATVEAALRSEPQATRCALEARADVALLIGDLGSAATWYAEASTLACADGDLLQATWDLGSAGLAMAYAGDAAGAADLIADVFSLAERCGSPSALAFAHFVSGDVFAVERPEQAERDFCRAIELAGTVHSRLIVGYAEVALAASQARRHDVTAALEHYRSAIAEWQRTGAWNALWVTIRTLIGLLVNVGAYEDAAVLSGAAESARAGFPPFGSDAATLRGAKVRMCSKLGDAAFRQCAEKGSVLKENEVVGFALDALNRAAHGNR